MRGENKPPRPIEKSSGGISSVVSDRRRPRHSRSRVSLCWEDLAAPGGRTKHPHTHVASQDLSNCKCVQQVVRRVNVPFLSN